MEWLQYTIRMAQEGDKERFKNKKQKKSGKALTEKAGK